MKILSLRFKNLNSLYGEWEIDFTSPEYVSGGIFAITGPTGAGKSTILDAVCLALYGQTPRLEKINNNSNEIISRQSGECYAEVVFETLQGKYLSHWSQRKARGKADGNLQSPRHEISEIKPNQEPVILENKIKMIKEVVTKITGMDFQRFTRSMLLAQGGFDAFLKAGTNERAPILEQITGTDIYSKISILVFEKQKEEKEKLNRLLAESELIKVLTEEEEKDIREKLSRKEEESSKNGAKYEELTSGINRLESIETLKGELKLLDEELTRISKELENTEPLRNKLNRANKAADLDSLYVTILRLREQLKQHQDELRNNNRILPGLENSLTEKERLLQDSLLNMKEAKKQRDEQLLVIKKVRDLDTRISEKEKRYQEAVAEYEKRAKELQDGQKRKKESADKIDGMNKELQQYKEYMQKNRSDENLVTSFGTLSERINQLEQSNNVLSGKKKKLKELHSEAKSAGVKLEKQQAVLKKLQEYSANRNKQIEGRQDDLNKLLQGKLLREYRNDKEALLREKLFLKKIESLEDERKKLLEGKPCPLCGSEHHPYSEGNIPHIDETEAKIAQISDLIEKAENIESAINDMRKESEKAERDMNQADREAASAAIRKEAAEEKRDSLENEYKKLTIETDDMRCRLTAMLKPFGADAIDGKNLRKTVTDLEKRLNRWLDINEKHLTQSKKVEQLKADFGKINAVITSLEEDLAERSVGLEKEKEDFKKLIEERQKIYGSADPDTEEKRFADAVGSAEKTYEERRKVRDETSSKLKELKIRINDLNKAAGKNEEELRKLTEEFSNKYLRIGFRDEKEFAAARLDFREREEISSQIKSLEDSFADIKTRKKDREAKLKVESEKVTGTAPLNTLKEEQIQLQQLLKSLGEEIGAFKQQLADNEQKKIAHKEKLAASEEQEKELAKWSKLNRLIGSADGKTYRNFAQGITFEIMIANANKQLAGMNDRYQLVRDEKEPLEINIIDSYQAGDIRSTKNLSGGESFIVSLSLALGLSYMASRNVRVDSLFLDEGFGTLDEEALETALEAFAGLYREGKVIGIISHVPALKERIAVQINVTPVSAGRSKISGPGCHSLR